MREVNLPCKLAFSNVKHDLNVNVDGTSNNNMQIVYDATINYLYERLIRFQTRITEHKTGKNSAIYALDWEELISVGGS